MRIISYYSNESFYVSECALYDIIKMRACMCLNALHMILLNKSWCVSECASYGIIKLRSGMCLNARHMMLLQ